MGYGHKTSGSGYGNGKHHRTVASIQRARSERAKKMDARLQAPLAKTRAQWKKDPAHFDWLGVDTPKRKVTSAAFGAAIRIEPEKPKIKVEHKTKEETNMTYLERAHLLALAKKYGIDRAEIDHRLSYDENKEYLERLASGNAMNSQTEMDRASIEADKWTGAYKDFMENVSQDDERWKDYF